MRERAQEAREWVDETLTSLGRGVVKGLDTPGQLYESLEYDHEDPDVEHPYSMGATMDLEHGYEGPGQDLAYDTGRAIGAAGPAVGALVNPAALLAYTPTLWTDYRMKQLKDPE